MITFFLSIFGSIKNLKITRKFISIVIIILLIISGIFYIRYLRNTVTTLTNENTRFQDNIENINFSIDSINKAYSTKVLTIKAGELEHYSTDIEAKLKQLNLKLKNISNVSNITYHYKTVIDTVRTIETIKDSLKSSEGIFVPLRRYNFDYNYNKVQYSGIINVPTKDNPFLSNTKIVYNDSLLITNEKIYKRRLIFWKRLTGMKLHVKSTNEDFKIDKIVTFNFIED